MKAYTEYSCDCDECKGMCKRSPCWGTPEEMFNLMIAGYVNKLALAGYDWYDDIDGVGLLRHVLVVAPMGMIRQGQIDGAQCRFLDNTDHCILHSKGLKPIEGRVTYHTSVNQDAREEVAKEWNTPDGKAVVQLWKEMVVD